MDLKEETSTDYIYKKEETSTDLEKTSMGLKEETSTDLEEKIVVMSVRIEAEVELREGRFHLVRKIHGDLKEEKCEADTDTFIELFQLEGTKYVYCNNCCGNGHEEAYKSSPIKHPLHQMHTLMFVECYDVSKRKCLCCQDPLKTAFYCCPCCDLGINLACMGKQPILSITYPKRHEHTLTLFPRQVTINCNACGSDDSRSPIYMCSPCGYIVHKRCIDLPWSIRISRHPHHRLSFTSSFDIGDRVCNICRRKINNDFGGYICNKEGCSYFAHSKCATGINVWDGEELEGVPEIIEEEVAPFEVLGDGIIRHFIHEHHPLKLNEDTTRVYDEYRCCEACVMPIYYGNFYSCLDCSFILHEACANISRRTYYAIHPHPLVLQKKSQDTDRCSACSQVSSGYSYTCNHEKCDFRLHIQCAVMYEPLKHISHVHPLYLTSAPEERRICSVCKEQNLLVLFYCSNETFNCIECECDFSLCFICAFLPQMVRYKHDDHILTLFYGEDTSETQHWCELCETKVKPGIMFYTCEDCCVTLHTKCLLGSDMTLGLGLYSSDLFDVIPNNRMTRPVCSYCSHHCMDRKVLQCGELYFCDSFCMSIYRRLNDF